MKQKGDLTRAERLEVGILLDKRYSLRSIAKVLQRSPNTVSYEVRENSTCGVYDPLKAHAKARFKKRMRRLEWSKIEQNPEIKVFVIEKLKERWNPDEIAGYVKRTGYIPYVSKTAIYEWLRTSRGERYCVYLYTKRKRVKKRTKKATKVMIPNRVGIERRYAGATNRSRYGHLERDTLCSRKGSPGGAAVHQERKSRFVVAVKVRTMRPAEHTDATRTVAETMTVLSTTTDNGLENRDHASWGMPTFFCDPYASWQKGGVEHANKMLRAFFPKGTDFSTISQRELDEACRIINHKPRKILGYRSAMEVAQSARLFKTRVS